MEVAVAGPQLDMEIDETARRDIEGGNVAPDHAAVEDHRSVGTSRIRREKVDDRMSSGLFLAVAGETHVDRQLTRLGELTRGGEHHVELALVVGCAARVEVAVAHLGLERVAVPELERIGWLDVEVPVTEHGRRLVAARRPDLADREWLAVPVDELGLAAGVADERADPMPCFLDVPRVRRIRADRGDAQELGELVEPVRGLTVPSLTVEGLAPRGEAVVRELFGLLEAAYARTARR